MSDERRINAAVFHPSMTPIMVRPEPELTPLPSIGRVVHYHSFGTPDGEYLPTPRAAIITALPPTPNHSGLSLAVLNPTGMFFNQDVPHSPTPKPGHWSWPPRT